MQIIHDGDVASYTCLSDVKEKIRYVVSSQLGEYMELCQNFQ
jgi:hypothetical protein